MYEYNEMQPRPQQPQENPFIKNMESIERYQNETMRDVINENFPTKGRTVEVETSSELLKKEPPIFTKEMQDKGELPKAGMKASVKCKNVTANYIEVLIKYISTKTMVYTYIEDESEFVADPRDLDIQPIDTRSNKKVLLSEIVDHFNAGGTPRTFTRMLVNNDFAFLEYTGDND